MSLRTQLAVLTGILVAATVIVVSLVAYYATRDRLRTQVDNTLVTRSQQVGDAASLPDRGPGGGGPGGGQGDNENPPDPFGALDVYFQVIDARGTIVRAPAGQQKSIEVTSADIQVANGTKRSSMHDGTASDGEHVRVLTSAGQRGEAVQVARSLTEVDRSLSGLRRILFGVGGAGIVLGALAGLLVAQRALGPVKRLREAAEHVASTEDLTASIEVRRNDEIGKLAQSFNGMLAALHESRLQQRQLVADASHELRTPLTSLRTNIEVLARSDDMEAGERQELLRDVTFEMHELSKLITELVDLASEHRPDAQSFEDVRLDEMAARLVERASRRTGMRIELDAKPALVVGNYNLLERAAGNLIDNACKWSAPDEPIDVHVADGRFEVRDRGPGIALEDRPHVFERFYRAESARSKPGSGLGLAMVKQIVDVHGGRVWTEAPADGPGAVVGFALSPVTIDEGAPIPDTQASNPAL